MENLSLKFYESLKEAILEAEKEGVLTVNKVLKDSITVNYLIDLPQYPICDIKSVEQVKFVFSPSCSVPIPYFMRLDFPNLPHLLIGTCNEETCLVQSDFEHFALSWNADFYQVYEWLFHSSRGTLHQNDQPLGTC
ncbi:MAG: hypothetical protein R2784_14800 [Saprospiraceae bacterium]